MNGKSARSRVGRSGFYSKLCNSELCHLPWNLSSLLNLIRPVSSRTQWVYEWEHLHFLPTCSHLIVLFFLPKLLGDVDFFFFFGHAAQLAES